ETVKVGAVLAVIGAQKTPKKKETPKAKPSAEPLSPAVRKLVAERDLNPSDMKGTGRAGRLTKADVLAHVPDPEPRPAAAGEERVRMSRMRMKIAERLKNAQNTAAMLTTFNEVDMGALMALRGSHQASFTDHHGVKLGIMSFFIKAAVHALREFPVVNAMIDEGEIVYRNRYDIGVAISTEQGLVVPVLRGVDAMDFAEIEKSIADFAARAREGRLAMEEMQGGTFSITNGGAFGSMLSTPILNPPQSAILGMHAIKDRPVAIDGHVVIRPMMYMALTYDHRLIDGREAVFFLGRVKSGIEDPDRLMLGI
ncbi:MAG: dihydrolipoyllysine-residue succinyltransferase, partial [Pseudomonadota bacterium]|nr:dihydrolipoyllysine-residue succinyltransferase [Pseudomonadota bacterium]